MPSPLGRGDCEVVGEVFYSPLPAQIGSEVPICATFPKGEGFCAHGAKILQPSASE